MRVLHVIPSVAVAHGGPSAALRTLAAGLSRAGAEVTVATTDDDGPGRVLEAAKRGDAVPGGSVRWFPKQIEFYKVSLPLGRWVRSHVGKYDVVHVHTLFSYSSTVACTAALRARVPCIVRPLGVLNRWGRENRRPWLKALSLRWVERPMLARCAGIHYTSQQERIEAEEAGVRAPFRVIPIGIDVERFQALPPRSLFTDRFPLPGTGPIVLFMSRLDPKKRIELLLEAFVSVKRASPGACLVIAGDGDRDYVSGLRARSATSGVDHSIVWTGFLDGELKLAALGAADVFVLPSHSENLGIVVLEALAAGLPCVLTPGVAVAQAVQEARAGLVAEAEVAHLSETILRLLSNDSMRGEFADRARMLAAGQFSAQTMCARLMEWYEEVTAACGRR